jgi:transposase InsO family protein
LSSAWVEPDKRDKVVDFVEYWSGRTEIDRRQLLQFAQISRSRYYDWRQRYGKVNEHNAMVPRDHWLEQWEKEAIIAWFENHPTEGYRRLTYMMMDAEVVFASPSSVYRVLRNEGLLDRWNRKPSKKGTGFVQPLAVHAHWHIDISYLNLGGTFYYLCCVLDGCSRSIVEWDIKSSMKEADVELVLQRAKEKYPDASPRIISDNGPQFIARDFKEFVRLSGMTHVRTSPYYPQSNGKIERFHKTIKSNHIRQQQFDSLVQMQRSVGEYIEFYNTVRLHSAIGYVTPQQKLNGEEAGIFKQREEKLNDAREARKQRRKQARENVA